ncbi:MAG: tannase/feruloyl esterase family alpha/beta hydrolase [Lysobacterales bacterium]|nr:MAG: tannase/feruloyl esterase family alpha/beta hydrolase [Xanthomonadales bacterium]
MRVERTLASFRLAIAASTLLAACGLTIGASEARAQGARVAPTACSDLKSFGVANTAIAMAETVAAGTFRSPTPPAFGPPPDYSRLPAFCRVAGSIRPTPESDIRFELWLPESGWNGKFMQTGNGGAAGAIVYDSLIDPLLRGYAVANTDTGHRGGGGDFAWAAGQPQKLIDYQYRAVHELTVAGKAITAARYGRPADKSYWLGCSTGGRQGLKEAQRYPEDYDGIVAGAPASNWSALMALSISIQNNLGPGGLRADKLGVLKEAAIAACDADDGVTDRVITDPGSCGFDPASLQCSADPSGKCLSPDEVAAARRIYAGAVDGRGQVVMPGTGPGSEPLWGAYASPQFAIGTSYFRNVVANDPNWDPAAFDVARDLALAERVDNGNAKAMDPDLSAFVARGGKLITYHGTTDGLIPFGNSVNYHESVVAKLGERAAADSVKLYLVPGMDHCSGGEGAFAVDWLTPLERWIERGEAPGALQGTHLVLPGPPGAPPSSGTPFERPICPYPQVPTYRGSGDVNDAASFECVAP